MLLSGQRGISGAKGVRGARCTVLGCALGGGTFQAVQNRTRGGDDLHEGAHGQVRKRERDPEAAPGSTWPCQYCAWRDDTRLVTWCRRCWKWKRT
eukprot:2462996-Rhodomonas_salina.1